MIDVTEINGTLFLGEATSWTHEQVVRIVREQLVDRPYGLADALRTAVEYCPPKLTSGEFVKAAVECGVNPGTARNRYREVQIQREGGRLPTREYVNHNKPQKD